MAMLGASDPDVFREALRRRSAIVTANPRDFIALARRATTHPGLVLFQRPLRKSATLALFEVWLAGTESLDSIEGMRVDLAPGRPPVSHPFP